MNEEPEKKPPFDKEHGKEEPVRERYGPGEGQEEKTGTGEQQQDKTAGRESITPEVRSNENGGSGERHSEEELRDEQGHRYLSPEAINAWRISGSLGSLVYWLIPLGYGALAMGGNVWPEWPAYVLGVLFLTYTILEGTVIPWIRWKRWRYHVDHNEIDLRRGLFVVTRTLIPIKRVQHVDTRQGPVYRQFGLASVTVTTAGDTHEIPALSEPVADVLRKTISEYARIAREDL